MDAELLASGVQVVLRIGLSGDGDQHPREGDDGNDDAQGHAGDDLPQVLCLLVRRPCGSADGCAEATSASESGSTRSFPRGYAPRLVEEHAPALQGTLVRLRAHEPADIAALNDLINDPEVGEGLGMVMPQALSGYTGFLEMVQKDPSRVDLRHRTASTVAFRSAAVHSSPIETAQRIGALMGMWLGKAYWDGGLGTDAVRTLCRFAFDHMNLQRIELDRIRDQPARQTGLREGGLRRRRHAPAFGVRRAVNTSTRYLMGLLADELIR